MTTRRHFLHTAALTSTLSVLPFRSAFAGTWHALHPAIAPESGPDDPILRQLAMRALDAARASGATYADVRMTADRNQSVSVSQESISASVSETGSVYIGVRALADGYWGFASGCDGTGDAVERLAREAVAQAKVNNWGAGAAIELDTSPSTAKGSWTTPVERDPFTVSVEEKADFLHGVVSMPEILGLWDININTNLAFRRQQKVFAATSGAFLTQTLIWTGPSGIEISYSNRYDNNSLSVPLVPLQSSGYEAVLGLRERDRIPEYVEQFRRQDYPFALPIGRYSVVFDARTTASLLRATIGQGAELDRIAGDEVNASGTSYLSIASLGTQIANPKISVTATRTLPRGPSRVAWDDDGVVSQAFDLVKAGTLVDLVTSRETAPRLAGTKAAATSRGCSTADQADNPPLVRCPDLVLEPAKGNATFDSLMAETKEGIAVLHGGAGMSRSLATGQGSGTIFEIRGGKLGRYLGKTAAFRFRTMEFWKNIVALGGASSAELHSFSSTKGEPSQSASHGVLAVPIRVSDVTVFDPMFSQ